MGKDVVEKQTTGDFVGGREVCGEDVMLIGEEDKIVVGFSVDGKFVGIFVDGKFVVEYDFKFVWMKVEECNAAEGEEGREDGGL